LHICNNRGFPIARNRKSQSCIRSALHYYATQASLISIAAAATTTTTTTTTFHGLGSAKGCQGF
jgi:hypothetical protein